MRYSVILVLFCCALSLSQSVYAETPDALLDQARKLRSSKEYADSLAALEKYWEVSRGSSHSAVRLSFALSDWIELGMLYPAAVQSLNSISERTYQNIIHDKASRFTIREYISLKEALDKKFDVIEDFYLKLPNDATGKRFVAAVLFDELVRRNMHGEVLDFAIESANRREVLWDNMDPLIPEGKWSNPCVGNFGPHGTFGINRDFLLQIAEVLENHSEDLLHSEVMKDVARIDVLQNGCIVDTL